MPLNGSLEPNTIYISLNARSNVGEYPVLHHANNPDGPWAYEARAAKPEKSMSLVALIKVAKVKNHSHTVEVMRAVPADGSPSLRTGEAFRCRVWLKDALVSLHEQGEIVLPVDVDELEKIAVETGLDHSPHAEAGEGATVVDDAF
ncbi:hypothetical protein DV735_g5831, partial [Chaetothyriales sp. CBS 134920]